jgi:hypothetical protein
MARDFTTKLQNVSRREIKCSPPAPLPSQAAPPGGTVALIEASWRIFVSALRRWRLSVSSRSRTIPTARGEIQRGAGTATWSRVSCRMRADVFIITWENGVNNRLRGAVRTGKFFGHGISQRAPDPCHRIDGRSSGQSKLTCVNCGCARLHLTFLLRFRFTEVARSRQKGLKLSAYRCSLTSDRQLHPASPKLGDSGNNTKV